MIQRLFAVLGCLVVLASSSAPARAADASDPRAIAVADQVMKALGGRERWDALPALRWSFGNSVNDTVRSTRRHAWDRRTGQHRVEGVTRTGTKFCFVHTVGDTTHGLAWMDGQSIQGDSLHKLIVRAEALWVNDTYWLLMPYKLRDPGVTLKLDGEAVENGATYDKLALSFAGVGLTPGDHYWVWVNRANHRIERWDMVLQGQQPPPVSWTLEGWENHDGLWFATSHRQKNINVFTNAVETPKEFPAGTFERP